MSGRGKKKRGKPPSAGATGHSMGPIRPSQVSQNEDKDGPPDPERMALEFERELVWCIQQLEIGLTSSKHKPDSRQAEDAMKLLRILQNPKAPIIKKRQVMRNTFGDYRKKMAEEQKKHESSMKRMKLEVVPGDKIKSTFIKKASTGAPTEDGANSGQQSQDMTSLMSNLSFSGGGDSPFSFDFKPQDSNENATKSDTCENNIKAETKVAEKESCTLDTSENFKFNSSNNSFRFNFSEPQSS